MHRVATRTTGAALHGRRQVRMGAQGRDVNAGIGRGIEHRGTGWHLDLVAIDMDANGRAELAHVLGPGSLPPLDFLHRVHVRSSCRLLAFSSPCRQRRLL
jgi:hypothetical protein